MIYLSGNHPFIRLKVKLRNKWQEIDCLIDTGFSGGLSVPQNFRENFSVSNLIETRFVLADGSEIITDATYTKVELEGREKEISIVFIGDSGNLVGVEFLEKMKFCLDLKDMKVSLE